nr:unnamed protein product [Callosobruchus analis]
MDEVPTLLLFNHTHHLGPTFYNRNHAEITPTMLMENISNPEANITRSMSRLTSPWAVTIIVLLVFLFSPMILIGNSLFLVAMFRFKRLRTPSNYLFMSLATSDLAVGMYMPVGMYLELGGWAQHFTSVRVCLFSYGVVITLCCVSVLVMVAIAVDRFTSLAKPLRYNNLITHSTVERYIAVLWTYSSLVGFTPLGYSILQQPDQSLGDCSFSHLVAKPVQLFMFCAVYGPSAFVLLACYSYIYLVARGHARAIRHEASHSSIQPHRLHLGEVSRQRTLHHHQAKYGLVLAITAGMFLVLWAPFQVNVWSLFY